MMTEGQFKRLPVYARHEIERLRANESDLKKELHSTADGPVDLAPFGEKRGDRDRRSANTHVRFWFDETRNIYVDAYLTDEGVQIRGGDWIAIKPGASNSVLITTRGRR